MKRRLLIIGTIVASLSLAGCGNDQAGTQNDVERDNTETADNEGVKEDLKDVEDSLKETGEDIKDKIEEATMTEDQMIEQSEYIVKVKKIEKEKNNFELKVLENLKGNLSSTDIPNSDTLEKNHPYLVFLKVEDGEVVPTNGEKSYILLEEDNHKIFEKINKNK